MKSFIYRTLRPVLLGWEIKENKTGGEGSGMGQIRNAYKIFIGNFGWKRPIGRTRCRWEDIIMVPKRTAWIKEGWISSKISCLADRLLLNNASTSWGKLFFI
jgi:hypothetical protein